MYYKLTGKIIFIGIEKKNRGWFAKLLLADFFLRKGYSVIIGDLWELTDLMSNSAYNCALILKDFFKQNISTLNLMKEQKNLLINWDEEGLIYPTDEYYCALRLNKTVLNMTDIIVTWGERQKKTILNSGLYNSIGGVLAPLGNPRIDLLNGGIIKKNSRMK